MQYPVLLSEKAFQQIQDDAVPFEDALRVALTPPHQHPLRPGDRMDPECLHCKVSARHEMEEVRGD